MVKKANRTRGRNKAKPSNQAKPVGHNASADFLTAIVGKFISDILTAHTNDPWPQQTRRLRIGAAGGLFYAGLKSVIAEGIVGIMGLFTLEPGARWFDSVAGFLAGAIIGATAGAVASWLTAQKSGRMQFLIGMMGVTIFVTLFPGLQPKEGKRTSWFIEDVISVKRAFADTNEAKCVGDSAFEKGFKAFFGARDRYDKYAVVVASGKTIADAQAKLRAIVAEDQTLKLRVGPRACDNDFYPVFATDYISPDEAKAALEKIRKLKTASDAYLSPGPKD